MYTGAKKKKVFDIVVQFVPHALKSVMFITHSTFYGLKLIYMHNSAENKYFINNQSSTQYSLM